MAGATAEILLPSLSPDALTSWDSIVAHLSSTREGEDFWIRPLDDSSGEPLPFFSNATDNRTDGWIFEGAEDSARAIQDAFGFTPSASIMVGAMCRGNPSERILARLCSTFLTGRQGVLLFDGLLTPPMNASLWSTWKNLTAHERADRFMKTLGPFVGRIVAVPIEGKPSYHAVDLEFLYFWQNHKAFHFVK